MALNFPNSPTNGQVYTDAANGVEYTYSLEDDSWTGTLSSANAPINPDPADVSVTPAFGNPSGTNPGTGTQGDPYIITSEVVSVADGTAQSDQFITITNGSPGNQVLWTNNTTPAGAAAKFTQPVGMVDSNGQWSGYLYYNDSLGDDTTVTTTYTGDLQVGSTSVYFRWQVQQTVAEPIAVDTASVIPNNVNSALLGTELTVTNPVISGGTAPFTYSYQWETSDDDVAWSDIAGQTSQSYTSVSPDIGKFIRCNVTVTDSAPGDAVQSISSASNSLNIISLTVAVNTNDPAPGDTVSADDVVSGGKPPENTTYQWLANGATIPGATNQSYSIPNDQAGNRLSVTATLIDAVPSTVQVTSAETNPVQSPIVTTIAKTSTRFDSGDKSYLNRTMGQGNQQIWTVSFWAKFCASDSSIFYSVGRTEIKYEDTGHINFWNNSDFNLRTDGTYIDPASWYNFVIVYNSTEAVETDRAKIYVNGEQTEWSSSANYPAQNFSTWMNSPALSSFGGRVDNQDNFFSGYLADITFVDNQALDATSFGITDVATGKWVPVSYSIPTPSGPLYSDYGGYGLSTSPVSKWLYAFNGETPAALAYNVAAYTAGTATYTFPTTIDGKLEFYYSSGQGTEDGLGIITLNGGTAEGQQVSTSNSVNNPGWSAITGFTGCTGFTLSSGQTSGGTPAGVCLSGVKANDVLLVNNYGYNSFHLAMDPSVNGENYTQYMGPCRSGDPAENAFDGNLSTGAAANAASLVWSGTLPSVSNLRIKCRTGNDPGNTSVLSVSGTGINGTLEILGSEMGNEFNVPLTNPGNSVSDITVSTNDQASLAPGICQLWVNGDPVVDYTSIGADDSGLNNNWYQNHLVSKSQGVDYVSQVAGVSPYENSNWALYGGFLPNASRMFDGVISQDSSQTVCWADSADAFDGGGDIKWTPTTPIAINSSLKLWCAISGSGVVKVNGTNINSQLSGTPYNWHEITGFSEVASIEMTATSGSNTASIGGIEIDGELLTMPDEIDILYDTPSDYDNSVYGAGNYATLNPVGAYKDNASTLVAGNLQVNGGAANGWAAGTIAPVTGKWYYEVTMVVGTDTDGNIGTMVTDSPDRNAGNPSANTFSPGQYGLFYSLGRNSGAYLAVNDGVQNDSASSSVAPAPGQVLGCLLDLDAKEITFKANDFTLTTLDLSSLVGPVGVQAVWGNTTNGLIMNFGQRAFKYPKPAGYNTICTFNLPEPSITYGNSGNEPFTYTGSGATNTIDSLSFSPGLTWLKSLGGGNHALYDVIRGATETLSSDIPNAETVYADSLTAFDSNGFTLGDDDAFGGVNLVGQEYISWNWYAGETTSTVAVGSLDSQAYNQNSVWSNNATCAPGGFSGGTSAVDIFNGVLGNNAAMAISATGNIITVDLSSYSFSGELQLNTYTNGTYLQYRINGGSFMSQGDLDGYGWINVGTYSAINTIEVQGIAAAGTYLGGVMVDGVVLVDNGLTPPQLPSIETTVRANPATGFSIVTCDVDQTAESIAHSLNGTPALIIAKSTDDNDNWVVYHEELGPNNLLILNTADAKASASGYWGASPTSLVFDVGVGNKSNNQGNPIYYCWTEIPGYSRFGGYTGEVTAGNFSHYPFIYCGFRPSYVMIKNFQASNTNWVIMDTARSPYNIVNNRLYANSNSAQDQKDLINVLSNGFQVIGEVPDVNTPNAKYIYAAFASNPFKYSNAH